MKKIICSLACIALIVTGCSKNDEDYVSLAPEEGEQYSGGVATVNNATEEAFGFAYTGLTSDQATDFGVGNSFFRQTWVSAPSSTTARDGLGPFYNAVACASCHFKDGRGRPPMYDGELGRGLLIRLSTSGINPHGGSMPDPVYGGQLQDNAILGPTIKGQIGITYQIITETFADGTTVELQKPIYTINNLGYGPLASGVMFSPRIANQIIGLGLLEAVPEATILGFADEFDSDGDGISGRPNYVYDVLSDSQKMGRFGWKANQPNIKQQVAGALSGDMGITSYIFPDENCPPGVDCNSIPNGGSPEITDISFDRMVLYSSALAVPIRRNYDDEAVLRGKQIFGDLNCIACHKPKMQTGSSYIISGYANQTIRPYTDLLLHDMGPELADNAPDYLATGSEWRTPPLWGIGLVQTVNGHTNFMHDGRARNITEAILWHGGEAQASKNKFKELSASEREDLLKFLNSL
ncbi:c-type cytochrome [Flavobacterium alkalisoli]|uniref:C-type cytochrome n=1 Tax=Flavobacterium alkalisoli TaxID=2602769 RepID=A0A5B9FSA6_9FLAO|nr:di-heme oxidoredictase family protein [Flavobacterium alkalisoli]QEE49804.1 c-type cytochrome [Flavobacterium alkalisoli]